MTSGEIVIAVATLAGPIAAVQVQKLIERTQARRQRKQAVFYALMTNRGAPLAPPAVQALNMVEIEFNGRRILGRVRRAETEEAVLSAWATLFAHLNNTNIPPNAMAHWGEQFNDLYAELLVAIGRDLAYNDMKTADLKWHTYSPIGPAEDERAQRAVRDAFRELLDGKRTLAVEVRTTQAAKQEHPAVMAQ